VQQVGQRVAIEIGAAGHMMPQAAFTTLRKMDDV
jgi:hypothetical protein